MISPDTASVGFTANSPVLIIDTKLVPGEAHVGLTGLLADVSADIESLLTDLPYISTTFSERRRIVRQTYDEVRDVIYFDRDNEIYLILDLDGDIYDVTSITEIELSCTSADGTATASLTLTGNSAAFDLSRRAVVRGVVRNVLVVTLSPTILAANFVAGLWNIDIFITDANYPDGVFWSTVEWEIRSLFEGSFIAPSTGSISITTTAPSVVYLNLKPETAALALTGNAPVINRQSATVPGAGAIAITGNAPTISGPIALTPSAGTVSISGQAPELT